MTPKEKAKELFCKCYTHAFHPSPLFNTSDDGGHTKKLALICIDEILKSLEFIRYESDAYYNEDKEYYERIKQEIEKI